MPAAIAVTTCASSMVIEQLPSQERSPTIHRSFSPMNRRAISTMKILVM